MEHVGKMKIIFVVSEDSITKHKGEYFKNALSNLVEMFEDIDILKDSIALLINKASRKIETLRNNFIEKIDFTDEKSIKVIKFT
jgi:GTP1/Obg family GTP-binding protein